MAQRTPAQIAYAARKRAERLASPPVPCACGCGELIASLNAQGKPARYKVGHGPGSPSTQFKPGHATWNKDAPHPAAAAYWTGRTRDPSTIEKALATKRAKYGGKTHGKERYDIDPIARQRVTDAVRRSAAEREHPRGQDHPLYGRRLPPETIAKISGANNHGWKGGVGTIPYGPEFTRRFKALIRDRDGHRCRRCGKTREQNGRTLPIHHRDYDPMNNDPSNLATVCTSCNVWLGWHPDEPFTPLAGIE